MTADTRQRRFAPRVHHTDEQEGEIVRMYRIGAPVAAICDYAGCGRRAIYRILHEHNVERRSSGRPRQPVSYDVPPPDTDDHAEWRRRCEQQDAAFIEAMRAAHPDYEGAA